MSAVKHVAILIAQLPITQEHVGPLGESKDRALVHI
jgi:hypothetical protein